MKAIPGKYQHMSVMADIGKRKISKVVRKTCAERRKISLLKVVKIRKQSFFNVIELVDIGVPNLRGYFKNGRREKVRKWLGEAKKIHGGRMKR